MLPKYLFSGQEVGGLAQLLKIQLDTPTIGNATRYAKLIREDAVLKRSIRVATDIAGSIRVVERR